MRRTLRSHAAVGLAVLAVGVLASGCDWYQLGALAGLSGDNSFEPTITPANVSTLVAHFNATDGTMGIVTPQAVVNGVLYASDAGGLEAYSANGGTDCSGSPLTCAPMWSYPDRIPRWQFECTKQQRRSAQRRRLRLYGEWT